MIRAGLGLIARHGKLGLIVGLAAGVLLPDLAQTMRPWIPEMVAFLLFLTAFRIGPVQAVDSLSAMQRSVVRVLILQLALPLAYVLGLWVLGLPMTPLALAVALMLSAPSVTGAANFAILLGHDPAPALRLLVVGTAALPLTCIPVFFFLPEFGGALAVFQAASRLLLVIGLATGLGFALRHWGVRTLSDQTRAATDGLMVIALAIIVIALMSAIRPAFDTAPGELLFWLIAAFAVNFGSQILAFVFLRQRQLPDVVPTAIVAGNRNFALFFVALPPEATDPLLIFLGCYQFPMYLTPTLLRPLYDTRRRST